MADPKVKRVLMSVTDKTGVVEFARALSEEFGAQIISTGGTARVIAEAGIPVTPIDEVTQFPEMMDGRVKTLHPAVHGGLLAKRDNPEHMAQAAEHGIEMIDMVVVNLYAFEKTVESGADFGTCIENIDIGGPSMLRSAAKNFASVAVVTDPASYGSILAEMRANDGATTLATRTQLALRVFQTTNAYDGAIAAWLGNQLGEANELFPEALSVDLVVGVPDNNREPPRRGQRHKFLNILNRLEPNLKFPHKSTSCNCTNLFFSCIIGGNDPAVALTSPYHRWMTIIIAVFPEISTVGLDD